MKLKMAENSLFAILLRSSWWWSFGIALGIVLIARLALPPQYFGYGASGAFPFVVIGVMAAWKQSRLPSAARVADTLQAISAMSWNEFSSLLESSFRRDGHAVTRLPGPAADFELAKSGRIALVSCKRWKVARAGIEPLRELNAAKQAREAQQSIFVTTGELTDNARKFAASNGIQVWQGAELAQLLRGAARGKKKQP
jgi:restriction system protein